MSPTCSFNCFSFETVTIQSLHAFQPALMEPVSRAVRGPGSPSPCPPFSASVVASLRGLWNTQEGRGSDMGLMERRSSALTVMGQDRTDSKDGASYLAWRGNSPAHPVAGITLYQNQTRHCEKTTDQDGS